MSVEAVLPTSSARPRGGVLYAIAAFLAWGFNPVYFKALQSVPVLEVLAHRVLWSSLLLAVLVSIGRFWPQVLSALASRKVMRALLISTALVASNWGLYIWAIDNDRVIETSIGYFINPLISVLLGVVFLGERLNRIQMVAVALAAIGVANLAWQHGAAPWIALYLAVSFGLYGLVRKVAAIDALGGLFIETLIVLPFALGWLFWLGVEGSGALGRHGLAFDLLLLAAGPVTALPLLWFSAAARRLKLSTVGFFQYIAPSTQLMLAVFLYGEPFTQAHAFTFPLIWTALALITFDAVRRRRAGR